MTKVLLIDCNYGKHMAGETIEIEDSEAERLGDLVEVVEEEKAEKEEEPKTTKKKNDKK